MREPTYLSPTSMSKWAEDPNAYYLKYLSDNPIPQEPQTQAMSVGSAFDAFVKSHLYEALFGSPSAPGNDARFAHEAIFEDQVDPHNRDWARKAGEHCFTMYRTLGALDGLMMDLGRSNGTPKFEMDVRGPVTLGKNGVVQSVPFRVKPDLHYVNEHGAFVILDWKVNGYCSASGRSPTQGFVRARRPGKMPWTHDDCTLSTEKGLFINIKKGLEMYDHEWARQCSVGAWVCGAPVGTNFICVIHQLACAPVAGGAPKITVAEHAGHVTPAYQEFIHQEAAKMWSAIVDQVHQPGCTGLVNPVTSEKMACACPRHVFRNLNLQDSIALCELLDKRKESASRSRFVNPALD